jgi:hypothetical protein
MGLVVVHNSEKERGIEKEEEREIFFSFLMSPNDSKNKIKSSWM